MPTKATSRRVKQVVKRYRASTVPLGTKPFPRRFPPPDLEIPRKPERPACGLGVFSAVGFRYQSCNAKFDLIRGQRQTPTHWGVVILDELEWRADSWLGHSGRPNRRNEARRPIGTSDAERHPGRIRDLGDVCHPRALPVAGPGCVCRNSNDRAVVAHQLRRCSVQRRQVRASVADRGTGCSRINPTTPRGSRDHIAGRGTHRRLASRPSR